VLRNQGDLLLWAVYRAALLCYYSYYSSDGIVLGLRLYLAQPLLGLIYSAALRVLL